MQCSGGKFKGGREGCLATSRGITRTIAHSPAVTLPMSVAVDAQPVAGVTRDGHLSVVGAAAVLETADFGFEFAAFFLLGLGWVC